MLFNIFFGGMLGAYLYQLNLKYVIDALYLAGNAMTFYAASTYYSADSSGIVLTALLCALFGTFYGLGVLRFFRWGLDLSNRDTYIVACAIMAIIMSWSIHRHRAVQDEYHLDCYNPINASLSYSWRQLPQVIVFVEAFKQNHHARKKSWAESVIEQMGK